MNPRFTLGLVGVLILALATICFAADTQERVAPPMDQDKMHLSVVGTDRDIGMFGKMLAVNVDLAALKSGVHYHEVVAGTPMFNERYRPNVNGLPTVRLQDAKGVVLYESAGADVPRCSDELLNAIGKTNQILKQRLLPWRKKIEKQCDGCDNCGPENVITPEDIMYEDDNLTIWDADAEPPASPEPDGVAPWIVVLLTLGSAVGGGGLALVSCIKKEVSA